MKYKIPKNMKNYKVEGFLEEEKLVEKQTVTAKGIAQSTVGFLLDEIQLQATIKSRSDVNHLVDFLKNAYYSFSK